MNIESNNSSVKNRSYFYIPCPVRIINFSDYGGDTVNKQSESSVFCEYCEDTTAYDY